MGARAFIVVLLIVAAAGAGAALGISMLIPPDPVETPTTAVSVVPGPDTSGSAEAAGESAPDSGAPSPDADQQITVDDLPAEVRQAMAENPELAARIEEMIASGELPPDLAFGIGRGGNPGGGFGGIGRGGEPLPGTVISFDNGMLNLDTPDGPAAVSVADDTPVNITKAVSEAAGYMTEGAQVTVVAQPDDAGGLSAQTVVLGDLGGFGGVLGGAGVGGGFGGLGTVVTGMIASFTDGVLTVESAEGPVAVEVADEVLVLINTTASEAQAELAADAIVTVLVQRAADGSLEAVTVIAGSGFGGGPFGGRGAGGAGRGAGGAGNPNPNGGY